MVGADGFAAFKIGEVTRVLEDRQEIWDAPILWVGLFLVVVRLQCSYHAPARYDDVLTLVTRVENVSAVKIEHSYRLLRGEQLLASATSTLACVDRDGKVARLPESISSHP